METSENHTESDTSKTTVRHVGSSASGGERVEKRHGVNGVVSKDIDELQVSYIFINVFLTGGGSLSRGSQPQPSRLSTYPPVTNVAIPTDLAMSIFNDLHYSNV